MATVAKSMLELKPRFTREDLRDLMRAENGWRLSLFMPLVRTGRDVHQAPIMLKDLRAQAIRELDMRKAPLSAREEILSAVDQILRERDTGVLQGEGLAIFASEHQAFSYLLPESPRASVTVGRKFNVEPILPLLYEDGGFYLLALGLKDIRLYQGDRTAFAEIPLNGLATGMREALGFEDGEAYLGFRSFGGSGGAGNGAMHYGHGGGKGDVKEMKRDILRFFRQLDDGMRPHMADPDRPLLLSGTEALLPLYREASVHPRILDVSLPAHLDKLGGPADLHAKALSLFAREKTAARKALLDLYRERIASPWASSRLDNIVPLADQGRLSHLFIRRGYRGTGAYDPSTCKVSLSETLQDGDEELVGRAAADTLLSGGKVHVVEMGEMIEDIAALCRY